MFQPSEYRLLGSTGDQIRRQWLRPRPAEILTIKICAVKYVQQGKGTEAKKLHTPSASQLFMASSICSWHPFHSLGNSCFFQVNWMVAKPPETVLKTFDVYFVCHQISRHSWLNPTVTLGVTSPWLGTHHHWYTLWSIITSQSTSYQAPWTGPALADAGPNARPGRGAQCKT